jgi:hypothetical protein
MTLEAVKALQSMVENMPFAEVPKEDWDLVNGLSIASQDAVLNAPSPDRDTVIWKMGFLAGLREGLIPASDEAWQENDKQLAILCDDIGRFLTSGAKDGLL